VDIRKKEIAGLADDADVVLDVQRELEIIAPVATLVSVGWEDGIVEENFEPVEVGAEAIEDDDVGRDDEEVAGESGVGLVKPVEETPRDEQGENLGLPGAGRHLQDVARPVLIEHTG
jgi:hypothetical protein